MGRAHRSSSSPAIPIPRRCCSRSPNSASPGNASQALLATRLTWGIYRAAVPSTHAATPPWTSAGAAPHRRCFSCRIHGMSAAGYGSPSMSEALLEVQDLVKHFPVKRGLLRGRLAGWVRAVDGVSFALQPGETFAIVGESGCGKTTLANLILGLLAPTSGTIWLRGQPLAQLSASAFMAYRRSVTAVFQDPYAALNPRMRVGDIVAEPLEIHRYERRSRHQRVRQV